MWSASKPGADFIGLSELQRLAMKERFVPGSLCLSVTASRVEGIAKVP
jgi:hypothetical protein